MKLPTILIAATLMLGGASALPLSLPTCDIPALQILCVRVGGVIVGDTTVGTAHGSTEAEFNNGTYVFQGTVTADEGGRIEIILADVAFSGSGTPVHVLAGGTLVIDASTLVGTPATLPTIVVEEGGTVVVLQSAFSAVTLEVRTDDADFGGTGDYSEYTLGAPALRLVGFNGRVPGGHFRNNTVGIEITGGAPTLEDIYMITNEVGIDAADTTLTASRIDIFEITGVGLRAIRSAGTMQSMAFADRVMPPTTGLDIRDTSATMFLTSSHVHHLGTGLFTCNASVSLAANDFHDNLEDFADCTS